MHSEITAKYSRCISAKLAIMKKIYFILFEENKKIFKKNNGHFRNKIIRKRLFLLFYAKLFILIRVKTLKGLIV